MMLVNAGVDRYGMGRKCLLLALIYKSSLIKLTRMIQARLRLNQNYKALCSIQFDQNVDEGNQLK